MTEELEKQLFDKYPEIFRDKDKPMNETCMCWGIDTGGDGWYNLLDELLARIKFMCDSFGVKIIADQVKSKYGGLRFYNHGTSNETLSRETNRQIHDVIDALINEAESRSYKTCEECGDWAKTTTIGGWVYTLCDKCKEKHSLNVK